MNKVEYLTESLSSILDDHNVKIEQKVFAEICETLQGSLDLYDFYSGNEVASSNRRETLRNQHFNEGANKVLKLVEELCSQMDGQSEFFDKMTHSQKIALATVFNLRKQINFTI